MLDVGGGGGGGKGGLAIEFVCKLSWIDEVVDCSTGQL